MRRWDLTLRTQFWVSLPCTSTESNSPPNALKVELGEFMEVISCLTYLQGIDPRGLSPVNRPSALPSNLFRKLIFLGNLPYITHHYSLYKFPMCAILCPCFFHKACYYDLHNTENFSFIQWHLCL